MNDTLKTFINSVVTFATEAGIKLILALLVLVIGLKVAKIITKRIMSSRGISKLEISVRSFLNNLIIVILDAVVIVSASLIIGIPATSFIALLGTAGVAIGLSLQGAFSNFAGGIMILIFHPFKVGHYIEADGLSGTVKDISIFYTVLKTPDAKDITIPNGTLMNASVTNYSSEPVRRLDIVFPVAFDTDMEKVKEILLKNALEHNFTLKDPTPFARLTNQTQNALEFTLRIWCENDNFWDLKFDLIESIKKDFDANNIVVPYQQLDIHIDK